MYKILICDDDAIFVKELEKLIKECNKNKRELEFTRYYSGEDLLNNLQMDRMKTCFTMEASYNREKVVLQTSDIVYFTHHKKRKHYPFKQRTQQGISRCKTYYPI